MSRKTNEAEAKLEIKWFHRIPGMLLCLIIAIPAWLLGKVFPIIGGPVIAILTGILLTTAFPKLLTRKLLFYLVSK
jgi:uncharacterized membrane protein YadS